MTKSVEVDPAVAAELKELRQLKKDYERLKIEHDRSKVQPAASGLGLRQASDGARSHRR